MDQIANAVKKKIKFIHHREEESNELHILHGCLVCCSQKIAWLPKQMPHQMNYL